MPRLGGLALFLGIFVPSLAFLPLGGEMRGILLGAAVATTVGAIDDFRGLRWWEKLGGPGARRLDPVHVRRLGAQLHVPARRRRTSCRPWVGIPLTIVAIVAVMNMVNFLDGLDGLAAGVCAISAFSFCRDRARRSAGRTRRS